MKPREALRACLYLGALILPAISFPTATSFSIINNNNPNLFNIMYDDHHVWGEKNYTTNSTRLYIYAIPQLNIIVKVTPTCYNDHLSPSGMILAIKNIVDDLLTHEPLIEPLTIDFSYNDPSFLVDIYFRPSEEARGTLTWLETSVVFRGLESFVRAELMYLPLVI